MGTLPTQPVNLEWEEMRKYFKELEAENEHKNFKFDTVCPYPFYISIIAIPFPKHFEIPNFEKFMGREIL